MPVTEKSNPPTRNLDKADAEKIVQLLGQCDAEIFQEEGQIVPTYQVTHSQTSDTAKEMLSQPHLNIYPPRLRFLSLEILSPLLHSNPLSSVSFLFPSSPLFCLFMYLFCEAGGFIPWGNVWRSEDNFWESVCSFIMWVTGSNSDHQAWRQSPYPQSHLMPPS